MSWTNFVVSVILLCSATGYARAQDAEVEVAWKDSDKLSVEVFVAAPNQSATEAGSIATCL